MEKNFEDYFNLVLRDSLKYPERFTIRIADDVNGGYISLIPDRPSELLKIIRSDPIIRDEIILQILKSNKIFKNVTFESQGSYHLNIKDIDFLYTTVSAVNKKLDTGFYSNKMEEDFDNYFNFILRDYLKYTEKFIIRIHVIVNGGSVSLKSNIPSKLIKILQTDSRIRDQITSQIAKSNKDFRDVSIEIKDNDYITINYTIVEPEPVRENLGVKNLESIRYLDIGIYSNIISNLPEEDVNKFCLSDPYFKELCEKSSFWSEMIKQRYPEYYVELKTGHGKSYDWKKIYYSLLWFVREKKAYDYRKGIIDRKNDLLIGYKTFNFNAYKNANLDFWINLVKKHELLLEYLINNNIIKFEQTVLEYVLSYTENYALIKNILEKYNSYIDSETLNESFNNHIFNRPIARLFLDYRGTDSSGNPVQIDISGVRETIEYVMDHDERDFSIEELDFYFQYIYPNGTTRDLIEFLEIGHVFQEKTIEYVVSKFEGMSTEELYEILRDTIHGYKPEIFNSIFRRYKHLLGEYKDDLLEMIDQEFEEWVTRSEYKLD